MINPLQQCLRNTNKKSSTTGEICDHLLYAKTRMDNVSLFVFAPYTLLQLRAAKVIESFFWRTHTISV